MTAFNRKETAEKLRNAVEILSKNDSYSAICHKHYIGEPSISMEKLDMIVKKIREIIFPGFFDNNTLDPVAVHYYMGVYTDELFDMLSEQILAGLCFACKERKDSELHLMDEMVYANDIAADFISTLPEMRRILSTDVEATFLGDPAAQSWSEVIFCYPTIKAISSYRIAHALLGLKVPIIPRIITEMAHSETGIDIHPRAEIGESFSIDHGTGTVIGATCIIGKKVKLYQGVTLGAKNFPMDENGNPIKGIPRHPIIEDNVVIYAQATILGRVTIGHESVIGGNVWVTHDVPPNSTLVQFKPKWQQFADGAGI
ncbi:MAG: serine acetyltransferase [Bacteroidales bacterium]|jgi:serine O-acetyltransferase|nr:serine acetyltransferase [Bacteroidales bacterium]